MSRWIRLYRDSLHNPKVVTLNDRQHRVWHNLLLIADDDGYLPNFRDIACHLRTCIQEAEKLVCELIDSGLVDVEQAGTATRKMRMHDWSTHQYVSDSSTERVRKFRNKNKTDVNETPDETECNVSATRQNQSQIQNQKQNPNGLRSSLVAARGKDQKGLIRIGSDENEKRQDKIVRRAEGLGMPVAEFTQAVIEHKARNRSAYFTTLCVKWAADKLPDIDEQMLRSGLWGSDEAYQILMLRVLEVSA